MATEPNQTSADSVNIRANTVHLHGGGINEPPQLRRVVGAAFGGGLVGGLLGALLCLLLRACGC